MNENSKWWLPEQAFFGEHYLEGDNSKEGYLIGQHQTLEQRTQAEAEGVIRLLDLKGKERILDIPSGYGRHSIALAKRGFNVTGVELNPVHLGKAIRDAEAVQVKPNFTQGNMIDISHKEEFDAIINMFYSFGFFETDEENKKVLENFFHALKPGGKFLFHTDVNVPRVLAGKYKEEETRSLVSGNILRIIDKYNPQDKRIHGTWIIQGNDGKEERKDYSVRVYAKEEFIDLCRQVGFTSFEVYSDWNKTPYSEDSEDMIVVAIK